MWSMGQVLPALDWILPRLVCPKDHGSLAERDGGLVCASGHTYAVRDGIPVLLRDDVEHTHEAAEYAIRGEERSHSAPGGAAIDGFVQEAIGATGGYLYEGLKGRVRTYPIPELRMPPASGKVLLDVGCSWGRWSVAAARLGYRVVGVDPSLEGVRAAYRVSRQLGVEGSFIVADARYLPLARNSVDAVFSYSVLQHFSKHDAKLALAEIARVLAPNGSSLIQLPNAFGVRSLYHQLRRGFREPRLFEVRYWTVPELRRTFTALIGPSTIAVDGFFSLNPQPADLQLLPWTGRIVVSASEMFRRLSQVLPILKYVADSLYISSSRRSL